MSTKESWVLIKPSAMSAMSGVALMLLYLLLGQISAAAAIGGGDPSIAGSTACNPLTDPVERDLCNFVTATYPDGLLTNWSNPRLPGHFDHAPMRDYGVDFSAIRTLKELSRLSKGTPMSPLRIVGLA